MAANIRICAERLEIPNPIGELPDGWENHLLYYGFGAAGKYASDLGIDEQFAPHLVVLSMLRLHMEKKQS